MQRVRQHPLSLLRGTIHDGGWGRGGEQESGAEVCAAIAGGGSEKSMIGEGEENNASGEGGSDRGWQGGRGESARLRTHGGGLTDPGGVQRLGEIQRWSIPQWGD